VSRDKLLPECTLYGGEGAGSGEVLAGIILGHRDPKNTEGKYTTNSPTGPGKKPVLFLTGEKRRDVIPNTLMNPTLDAEDRIPVEEMIVYRTTALEEFEFSFARMLQQTETARVRWVVVFSPTAGREMLRALGWGDDGGGEGGRKTFVACIGPTTREYLERECGFRADVVAERPSPQGVREGIERFMRERERGVEASQQDVLP
jgi:uroporphyrinogen-III synthase